MRRRPRGPAPSAALAPGGNVTGNACGLRDVSFVETFTFRPALLSLVLLPSLHIRVLLWGLWNTPLFVLSGPLLRPSKHSFFFTLPAVISSTQHSLLLRLRSHAAARQFPPLSLPTALPIVISTCQSCPRRLEIQPGR